MQVEIGTCWWCGEPANSREHKFKKTDIERAFGRGPYREGRTLVKQGDSGRQTDVTGSRSKVFKFEPMICASCNGVRSQPFDRAYDLFMDYIFENEDVLLRTGEVDLRDIYGDDWEEKALDLGRYFVKHICCRLGNVADQREVVLDGRLIDFLNGGVYPRCLGLAPLMDLSVAECWRVMRMMEKEPGDFGSHLNLTGLGGVPSPRPQAIENPEGGMLVGWFGIYWRIADDEYIPNQLAGPIIHFVPTDWLFGTENRSKFAEIARAIEAGVIDVSRTDFGELVSGMELDPARFSFSAEGQSLRPEPSPLGPLA